MHLAIVTPIYPPALGGAATYYGMLGRALLQNGIVERVTVLTEQFPGERQLSITDDGQLTIVRLFPYRAGGSVSRPAQYIRYSWQNLQYCRFPSLFRNWGIDTAMIHSSFHNHPNVLDAVLPYLGRSIDLIADVRDHLLPAPNLKVLAAYRRIVACSGNVENHLRGHAQLGERIVQIPIPQEPLAATQCEDEHSLAEFRLRPDGYILFGGLIKPGKGVDLLLQTYAAYRDSSPEPRDLVLAGTIKDTALARRASQQAGVRCLGALPRQRLLTLMRFAAVNVNLSPAEGLPRVSLEALALGTRVMLPAGIPEFDRYCADWVAASNDNPNVLASQLKWILCQPPPRAYPVERHYMSNVLPLYAAVLRPSSIVASAI
jgi:glycosyltransferase involved in cell wall biosynthesis